MENTMKTTIIQPSGDNFEFGFNQLDVLEIRPWDQEERYLNPFLDISNFYVSDGFVDVRYGNIAHIYGERFLFCRDTKHKGPFFVTLRKNQHWATQWVTNILTPVEHTGPGLILLLSPWT